MKKIWLVEITPGGTPLKFREKGGGIFTQEKYARERYEYHRAKGRYVRLKSAIPDWEVVEESELFREGPVE